MVAMVPPWLYAVENVSTTAIGNLWMDDRNDIFTSHIFGLLPSTKLDKREK